jgi:tetratricopeptide (TPR) repeat protein
LAEEKFISATNFKKKKNWFFKYARGYREKRQYERASQMYKWIMFFFPKDKRGGLEYAEMKLYDELKYAEAEEIVRRGVLDNFVNDPDGMLLLGDIYLEWACNEDPTKFELARAQYETVLDLYGQKAPYLAKMLRYYIRTDNLREVLPLKNYFYPDKKLGPKKIKALSADYILELSCYLLDKLYGELSPAEEYLRSYIEDVRALLERAIVADPTVPEAYYNYARYFIYTADISKAEIQLEHALGVFDKAKVKTKDRILKNIDTYRLLGELYTSQQEYLKSEELYVKGISLFESEKDAISFLAGKEIGLLYADMADLDYFISGDNDNALRNYLHAVEYDNDTSSIRYRIGYIQYGKKNYLDALGAFITSAEENGTDLHLLLSLANTLSLRDDNFAAQGYYQRFVDEFEKCKVQKGILFPQVRAEDADLVENYMKATNNFGVTLGKLSFRTGDSNQNALAMVYMAESMRAWDALTRNQETLVRLDGSNLAAQNMQYLRYPVSPFEPALYFDIPRTLQDEKMLTQPMLKNTR